MDKSVLPLLFMFEPVKRASVIKAVGQPIRLHRRCPVEESSEHCRGQLRVIGDEVNSMFSKGKVCKFNGVGGEKENNRLIEG